MSTQSMRVLAATVWLTLLAACGNRGGSSEAAKEPAATPGVAAAAPASKPIDDPELGAPLYPGATRTSDKYLRAKIGPVTNVVGRFSSGDDIGAIVAFYLQQCGPGDKKTSNVAADRGVVACLRAQPGNSLSVLLVKTPSGTRFNVITRQAEPGAAPPSG